MEKRTALEWGAIVATTNSGKQATVRFKTIPEFEEQSTSNPSPQETTHDREDGSMGPKEEGQAQKMVRRFFENF